MTSLPAFNNLPDVPGGEAALEGPPNWANERRLRALMENLQSGVVIHAEDSRVLAANSAACRMLGLSLDQMRGKTAMDPHWRFLEEDGSTMALARFPVQQVLANWQAVRDLVVGVQRAELAEPVWVICTAYPEYDPDNNTRSVVVTFSDVTELKRAKQLAVRAQEDLRATLQAVPDLMFEMALDGTLLGYHSPVDRLIVSTPEEFLGRKVSEVLPADAAAVFHSALELADRAGLASGQQYALEAGGKTHWFELSVARKHGQGQAHSTFIVQSRDITDRKHAEAARQEMEWELAEAQRMESIGTLAGGIAHDFNNILAAILGNIAIAREELEAGQSVAVSLEQIQRASLRARSLVQQILSFSRHDRRSHQAHALGPIVQETLDLMRATLPAGVSLRSQLGDEPLSALCDSTQLQQVVMNLCTNAWQAFNGRNGTIELGLDRTTLEPGRHPRQPPGLVGPCAHLRIADNGCGMDEDTLQRIFDPFFTTKPVGQGTGLGLSVVHGIVRAHGGLIEVESTVGVGSAFHIYLPLHQDAGAPGTPSTAPRPVSKAAAAPAAGRHILCIDDDPSVLATIERLLLRAGYRVSTATSAAAGIERLQSPAERFDAVITDYNMPEHSGLDVAAQAAHHRPGVPVLMMSGLMPQDIKAVAHAEGVTTLLFKERLSDELLDKLARLLA